MYTKKICAHEIAAVNLSKIYLLKNVKEPLFKSPLNKLI